MNRTLARNAAANIAHMFVSAILVFILFRYISTRLGVTYLGIWSVLLATVSASNLATFGLGSSVTRFVARDLAQKNEAEAAQAVQTGALTLMVLMAATLPLLYFPFFHLLPYLFENKHLEQAASILPYTLVSLWLTVVAGVFNGGIDGCQRMDLRAGVTITGQGLMLGLALWLVPSWGLMGLVWAQIGQGLFLFFASWLILRHLLNRLPWVPSRWSKAKLREMLAYGVNVQAASLFMLLLDPLTKIFMARFGGPEAAGYFEIANQVVLKTRSFIVAANQAVVPRIAELTETEPKQMRRFYRQSMRLLILVAAPVFTLLIVWSGSISWLLLGRLDTNFLFLLQLTGAAWFFNIFAGPAYFANMGTGSVGRNTISHFIMGVFNAILGWAMGYQFGLSGVAWGYALALLIGSWMLICVYQMQAGITLRDLRLKENTLLVAICLVSVFIASNSWSRFDSINDQYRVLLSVVLSLMVLTVTWRHPFRRKLWTKLISRVGEDHL